MRETLGSADKLEQRPLIQAIFYNDPDYYPPAINAIRLLCRAGFAVELFTRETGGSHEITYPPEARIVRLPPRGPNSWLQFLNFLRDVVRRARPDAALFWGHDMHGFLGARLAAWRRSRPLVYHCHDYADPGWMTFGIKLVHAFERQFARTADSVVIPDAGRAEVMAAALKLRTPPLVAANAPLLTPPKSQALLRSALSARGFHFDKIVFRQGRIGRGHGIEVTLRSMPKWTNPKWGFVVMGLSDAHYLNSLDQLAQSLGVRNRFVALPPVKYDCIMDYTRGADVGHALYEKIHVNNLYIGTASNKVMEYLAAGVPLLVSPNEKLHQLISEKACGACADETDPDSVAHAINLLLGEDANWSAMARSASAAFEEEYCYDRQFAPVIEKMQTLAAMPGESR